MSFGRRVRLSAIVFVYLLLLTLLLQRLSEAYSSEFGSHPDEAAHYVTGLMVHDYLAGSLGDPPMRFAKDYYDHYPKVAFGHWPPGFYSMFAPWALAFSPSRASTLVFTAFISALFSFFFYVLVRNCLGAYWGLGTATFLTLLPLIQRSTSSVMSDVAVSLFCLLAAMAFLRYLEQPRLLYSLSFGALASAAILTKQSGLLLALFAGLSLLLSRRIRLVKNWTLWMGAILVAVVCAPWLLLTLEITEKAWEYDVGISYSLRAFPSFLGGLVRTMGYTVLIFGALGFGNLGYRWLRKPGLVTPFWAVAASLPVAVVVFHSVVPATIDDRYLIPAVPGIIVLAAGGIRVLARWLSNRKGMEGRVALVIGVLVLGLFGVERFEVPAKRFSGFKSIVDRILSESPETQQHLLISSDSRGEGALIAELVMSERARPNHVVHRGSKVLATSSWTGKNYETRFPSEAELLKFLEQSTVSWVIVDRSIPADRTRPHNVLIDKALQANSGTFIEFESFSINRGGAGSGGPAIVYRKSANF